jgi:UDP-N-acetylglucosamine 2-epimerase
MGERYVWATGCPRIDLAARVAPERGSYALFAMHPVTTEDGCDLQRAAWGALLAAWPGHVHLFWPNADPGHADLVTAFKAQVGGRVLTHRSLPPEQYMALLAGAAVCVGNSSSAIREGAYLGTPVVDVGSRQRLREVADNVLRVSHADDLFPAIRHQVEHGRFECSTLYGDGQASEKIATHLGEDMPPVQKEWSEWRAIA